MKDLTKLDKYREPRIPWPQTGKAGTFKVFVGGKSFFVVASVDAVGAGRTVEHVSVSPCSRNRVTCPTWEEMSAIKDMFFEPEEECISVYPKRSEYVNFHETCLHIWRPTDGVWKLSSGIVAGMEGGSVT